MKHPLQQPTGIRHRIVVLISEMLARFDILCMCIIAFVLQLMMLELNAQQPAFITNGLVAYYPFNGNADDASGNGKNGTLLRGIFISDRFGNSSKALQNSLPVPNWGWAVDTGITSQFSSSFTLSVWFKHASPNDSILIAYGNSGVVDPYIAVVPDLIDYRLRVGKNLSLSDPRISDGNWHLMVATCKNGVASLYFDGNLVKKDSDSTPTAYSGQSWKES